VNYSDAGYAESLSEFAVSVVVVADPLSGVGEPELRRAFPDHVVPFKSHHVRDLDKPGEPPAHHRRHIRRASGAVEVEVCAEPREYLDDWTRLYEGLVARHGLTGIRAFSRTAFERQLELPGMVAVRAERGGETVGMALWLEDAPNAYYHLAAYSPAGYQVSTSYALFAVAFDRLRELGVRYVELGGAEHDGLTRFKRGWATEERTAHLCGRVLDRAAYDRLARSSDWFPAYRDAASA
jgi:Acetyltransferase (GNAT) domain